MSYPMCNQRRRLRRRLHHRIGCRLSLHIWRMCICYPMILEASGRPCVTALQNLRFEKSVLPKVALCGLHSVKVAQLKTLTQRGQM